MTQTVENKCLSLEDILKTLRSEAESMPPSPTSLRYLRALSSLESSAMVGTHGSCVRSQSGVRAGGLSPVQGACSSSEDSIQKTEDSKDCVALKTEDSRLKTALTDWLVNQWLVQTPFSTASLYLDIISALYTSAVKAGRLPKTTVFSEIKSQLKALGPDGWKSGIDDEIFQRALRLTKNANRLIADDAIAADLILLSLNSPSILRQPILPKADTASADTASADTPLIPLYEIAQLKSTDLVGTHDIECGKRTPCASPRIGSNHGQSASEDSRLKTEDSILSLIFNNLSLRDARRRYVFPLKQSQRTELQLKRHIAKICNALFRRARLPQASDPMQTVEALWAYAALRTGIPASKIVAALGHAPLGLPVLKLVGTHGSCVRPASQCGKRTPCASPRVDSNHGQSASEDSRLKTEDSNNCVANGREVFNRPPRVEGNHGQSELNSSPLTLNSFQKYFYEVGKVFLDNPPRWYAMSLRPGVRFTQVCRRIDLLNYKSEESRVKGQDLRLKTEDLRLFYPCEEIARAIGKKIVVKQRPFIHSVVFFQAKLTDIGPLFAKIGDLAWCYRQSSAPGAPYAEISDRQFRLFQQTIARFTPDYEVASSGELELKPNDRVEILGGLFAGHEATFVKSEESRVKSEETSTVYRLNIVGENGIEWRIGVDKRLAKQSN